MKQKKKQMKAFEIFLPLVLVAGIATVHSCCPKHYPQIVYRDSVRVEVHERVVHDTVSFEVPVIIEKNVTRDTASHLENDWAKSDASLVDGFLEHTLETKGRTVYVPVTTIVRDTVTIEKEAVETVKEVEVEKPLSWWQRLKLGAFPWLLATCVALLTYTFRKPILTLLRKIFLKV